MSKQARTRRHFDATFKLQVVRMIREEGPSVGQVFRDLDLTDSAYATGWPSTTPNNEESRLAICL